MENCRDEEYPRYFNWNPEKGEYYEVYLPMHDHYFYVASENSWYEVKI